MSNPEQSIRWTIPLTITVELGSPAARSPRTPQPQDRPQRQTELLQALEAARTAKTQPYYEETQDQHDAASYYARIDPSQGAVHLYDQLNQLVTTTHTTRPTYNPGKELYPWIDLRPNLKIRSIYSGQEFEAEDLIRDDFRIEAARAAQLHQMTITESVQTTDQFLEAINTLEAAMPYNCEHVVPQSWFGKKEPMRGDLHHLFACETRCNSFRGNTPYFDFADFEEAVQDHCGKRDGNKFEPGNGKGAIARATLYFLLRHKGQIDNQATEYTQDRLAILLDWHHKHPVDDYERHRNMAIFRRQGNRNPLIDHPDWARLIQFEQGLG